MINNSTLKLLLYLTTLGLFVNKNFLECTYKLSQKKKISENLKTIINLSSPLAWIPSW